jgi:hypothetical protein
MLSELPPEGVTAGFYKIDGELLYAPNYVLNKDWQLLKEEKDNYEYPVHGWRWFDSEDEARQAYGLPPAEKPEGEEPTPHWI